MEFYPNRLSDNHSNMLFEGSKIAPEIAAERGYYTARRRSEVPGTFANYQRRLGLVVPMFSPDRESTGYQLRPDNPRRGGPKYETPQGANVIVDVHPRMMEAVRDPNRNLWITEGCRKGDALMSATDDPVISFAGVWMWCVPKAKPYELKPCFDHVPLRGRTVRVVFDSDALTKPEVQQALEALVGALEERDAEVLVVYLEDAPAGSKVGADDFLAAGGTVKELKMLARKFEPHDLGRIRLSKDAGLRASIEAARSRWWAYDWARMVGTGERPNSMRGHSCRDAEKVAIDHAARSGQVVEDGVRFTLSTRTWALKAATSRPTLLKSIAHLEAESRLRRDYVGRAEGAAGSYVLLTARANLYQYGSKQGHGRKVTEENEASYHGGKDLRAPRLRWSAPTFDREGQEVVRGYVHRLGKIAGAIVDVLDKGGGAMDINEVAEALGRRARDLRRRNLPKLEQAGIVSIAGDTVSLTDDWLEALELERLLKGEIDAEGRDRTRYRLQREAFRNRREVKPDHHHANVGADGHIEDLRPADSEPEERTAEPAEVSGLAKVIRQYLDSNPHDACQPPGWLGITLWAYDLYAGKPTPAEVRAAIAELGGESYLRDNLSRARGRAA